MAAAREVTLHLVSLFVTAARHTTELDRVLAGRLDSEPLKPSGEQIELPSDDHSQLVSVPELTARAAR